MTERIVVTGGHGALGTALREFLPDAIYLSRKECDVTQPDSVRKALTRCSLEHVIHAAAITNHQHPNAGELIETNIFGTELVAHWCGALHVRMIYCSTHYVYPGEVGGYRESDATHPIGAYAWSKLAGERRADTAPARLIVRGSWYTPARVELWARQGAIADAYGSREPVEDAARKIAQLVKADAAGIWNIGGPRRTFYDIACATLGIANVRSALRENNLGPYRFPVDASVNTDKFNAEFGHAPQER